MSLLDQFHETKEGKRFGAVKCQVTKSNKYSRLQIPLKDKNQLTGNDHNTIYQT